MVLAVSDVPSPPADGPLGFACTWERPRQHTWSGTPLRFFEALRDATAVADLGPDPSPLARRALKAAFTRRRDGRWVTTWKWSSTWDRLAGATVRRRPEGGGCRARGPGGGIAGVQ